MKQALFIRINHDKGMKASPVYARAGKHSPKISVVSMESMFDPIVLQKNSKFAETQIFGKKRLNKTQEILKSNEHRPAYSRQGSILSIEDFLLLGKDLFKEPAQVKTFSRTPNITKSNVNTCIELQGMKTGTKKIHRSRPPSKQNFLQGLNSKVFKSVKPGKIVRKITVKKRTDTPSPWSANNY